VTQGCQSESKVIVQGLWMVNETDAKVFMVVVMEDKESILVVNVQGVRQVQLSNGNVGGACTYAVLQPLVPCDPPAVI
jgi:hypothetical protein